MFEALVARRRAVTPASVLGDALLVSAVAIVIDYGATPRRFTPGWEFVLSKRAMAVVYAAMALGLAGGAMLSRGRAGR